MGKEHTIKEILEDFGNRWEIALEMDDGKFEHILAKEHPFFLALRRTMDSSLENDGGKK